MVSSTLLFSLYFAAAASASPLGAVANEKRQNGVATSSSITTTSLPSVTPTPTTVPTSWKVPGNGTHPHNTLLTATKPKNTPKAKRATVAGRDASKTSSKVSSKPKPTGFEKPGNGTHKAWSGPKGKSNDTESDHKKNKPQVEDRGLPTLPVVGDGLDGLPVVNSLPLDNLPVVGNVGPTVNQAVGTVGQTVDQVVDGLPVVNSLPSSLPVVGNPTDLLNSVPYVNSLPVDGILDSVPVVNSLPLEKRVVGGLTDVLEDVPVVNSLPLDDLPVVGGAAQVVDGLPVVNSLPTSLPVVGNPADVLDRVPVVNSLPSGLPIVGNPTDLLDSVPVVNSLPLEKREPQALGNLPVVNSLPLNSVPVVGNADDVVDGLPVVNNLPSGLPVVGNPADVLDNVPVVNNLPAVGNVPATAAQVLNNLPVANPVNRLPAVVNGLPRVNASVANVNVSVSLNPPRVNIPVGANVPVVNSLPVANSLPLDKRFGRNASFTPKIPQLNQSLDDIDYFTVYYNDGTSQVLNVTQWDEMLEERGILPREPPSVLDFKPDPEDVKFLKRQTCAKTTAVVTDPGTQNFVDWDIQMSPVACGVGSAIDIFVQQGFSASNAISIGGGGDLAFVKDRLKGEFGVDYTRTVTTQTNIQTKGTVPDGSCGVMITKPLTTRRTGKIMEGCPGSFKQIGTWQADDRGEGSYGGVKWIAGAVATCIKKGSNPPLSRCQGAGNFR